MSKSARTLIMDCSKSLRFNMNEYQITISEPFEYQGPNPLVAMELGYVRGPEKPNWAEKYFLLNLKDPFEWEGQPVKQLIVAPRYEGVTLDDLQSGEIVVGIARVLPPVSLEAEASFKTEDVDYFAIGTIKPSEPPPNTA